MEREVFYNRISPFRITWIVYLLSCRGPDRIEYVEAARDPRGSRGVSFAAAICLHIAAFMFRCSITGWAPVTNMYETVIWVALIAAVVSLVL